jgi:hypothetical protein
VVSCAAPAHPTARPVQYTDPFYNINDDDYPSLHLPMIKPIEAKRQDGKIIMENICTLRLMGEDTNQQDNLF